MLEPCRCEHQVLVRGFNAHGDGPRGSFRTVSPATVRVAVSWMCHSNSKIMSRLTGQEGQRVRVSWMNPGRKGRTLCHGDMGQTCLFYFFFGDFFKN